MFNKDAGNRGALGWRRCEIGRLVMGRGGKFCGAVQKKSGWHHLRSETKAQGYI